MNDKVEQWINSIKDKNYTTEQLYIKLKEGSLALAGQMGRSEIYHNEQYANGQNIDAYMSIARWVQEQLGNIKPTVKKDIKVLIADGTRSSEYIDFLNTRFNVSVVKNGDECDLVVFTGGEDVSPSYYHDNKGNRTSCNTRRDQVEADVFHKYRFTPKLGICRGNQFLTVMNGGKLIQHLDGHGSSHEVLYRNVDSFTVTSTHHQASYPFNLNKNDYKILAFSKYFRSGTYLNGDNKEIDIPKDFVEVEIVKFKNCLGIQGHPEYQSAGEKFKNISLKLIDELIFDTDNFNKEINNEKEQYHEI